jgi:putative ABC transport system permease protein
MTSLAAALVGGRLMQRFLCDVAPIDLVSFAAVPLIVAAVTLVACLVPAWRAMRIDPLVALRSE